MSKNFIEPIGNEDHALFMLLKKRDKEAFAMIYKKYHRYLYAIALKYLKNEQLAEDVVQHVFVKLWENTSKIDIEINLKNYLYTMTKNRILNYFRDNKEAIYLSYENSQTDLVEPHDIVKSFEKRQMNALLYEAIDKLPPQKREVCIRKLESDDTNQQIADKMNISVHTVKSHYQDALKMLRKYFEDEKIKFL
ncbi:MAG: RNA polymerase sigma factor [Fermentimonas sp.]|jgi:RNA polymerase sigma-70 factor (family 1)